MLEARDLKKQFTSGTDVQILFEHLNFTAREGEFVVITGRSGSGKSTLLYLLGLLDTPSVGTVTVDEITGSSPYGASTIAGGDGKRMPSKNELEAAKYQGKHVAEITAKLVR